MRNGLPSSGKFYWFCSHFVPSSPFLSGLFSPLICSKCESSLMLGFGSCPTAFCKQPSSNAIKSQTIISRPSSVWCLSLTVHTVSQSLNSLQDRAYGLPLPQTHLSPGLLIYQASSKVRNPPVVPELPSPSPSTTRTSACTHPVTLSASYPPWQPQFTLPSLRISLYPMSLNALIWPRWESLPTTIPRGTAALCVLGSQPQTMFPGLCTPNPSQGVLFCFPAWYTVILHTSPLSCIACLKCPPLTPMACPQAKQAHRTTFWIDAAGVWNYRQPSMSIGLTSTEWITHRSK